MTKPVLSLSPVVLVEDDVELRRAIVEVMELAGLAPNPFGDAQTALGELNAEFGGVVVSDIRMAGIDGLELLSRIRSIDSKIPVILISGHADVPMAVEALQDGAFDLLTKPFAMERLLAAIERGLEERRVVVEHRALRAAAELLAREESALIGDSPAIVRLRETIEQVAKSDLDVLIEGETGVGKELVALELHRLSARRGRPFVPINCGAIPDAAADAELFGTAPEAGSLRRPQFAGRVAEAHRGALFLDEIDSSSAAFQSKLLRVLEEREFTSLGSSDARLVDLRVIAAAKADLQAAVDAGRFRQDLFYRLDVVRLHIPPLRERREDIMPLFAHFAAEGARRIGVRDYFVSDSVRQHLIEYAWPGNVRELRNFAFNVVLGLPAAAGQTPTAPHPAKALGERVDEFEEVAIREVLLATSGNVTESVARLGVPRKTLYAKFQRYGIDPNLYRQRSGETPHGRGSPV